MEMVTLKLPDKLLRDAARVAHGDSVSIGHMVRVLLAKEVDRRLSPKARVVADEGLLAALQALLASDMAEATGWDDLASRLSYHGYELRPFGGGLVLYKTSCETRVCKASELGFAYRTLVKRFGGPMPGHPQGAMGVEIYDMQPDAAPMNNTEKGRLQRALNPVFKTATDWDGLIARLARRNYTLRPVGAGLGLFSHPQGRHLCNTSTVGFQYRALVKRFGAAMPGHPHGAEWVTRPPAEYDESADIELIEREG